MKRNMDLIRKILIVIEEYPHFPEIVSGKPAISFDIPDHDEEEIYYHLKLLSEAGLILTSSGRTFSYRLVQGLTWQGHEFLELMKKDTHWNKAKEAMKETGGMAFEVLMRILLETATKAALGQLH